MAIKKIEYRSRPTHIIGERFYIYASKKWAGVNGHVPHADGIEQGTAPTSVIVGTATISRWVRDNGHYEWDLADVKRIAPPRKPKGQTQSVWFRPF